MNRNSPSPLLEEYVYHLEPKLEAQIEQITAKQHGVIAATQLVELGLSMSWAWQRASRGRLQNLGGGVFAVPGTPATYEQKVIAAVLASPPSVASHFSAMRLWEMGECDSNVIEVCTERTRYPRLRNVVIHRSVFFLKEEHTEITSIPCASFARTLVDVSGRFSLGQLGRMLDEGLRTNKTTLNLVRRCVAGLYPAPGRRLTRIEKLLGERLPQYNPGDSDLEVRVLRWIVEAGLPEPVQQHKVSVNGNKFRIDLAYPHEKIALEVDGFKFHADRSSFDHDRFRSNLLTAVGWRILRFTSNSSQEHMIKSIRAALVQFSK